MREKSEPVLRIWLIFDLTMKTQDKYVKAGTLSLHLQKYENSPKRQPEDH